MEFQEEIVYIRHLCGIDCGYSLKDLEIQNKEEPELYALCDECNMIAATSEYRHELEQEFDKDDEALYQVFRELITIRCELTEFRRPIRECVTPANICLGTKYLRKKYTGEIAGRDSLCDFSAYKSKNKGSKIR